MNLTCVVRNSPAHPALAVALCVLLVVFPGCAAKRVQQEIDTLQAHALALQRALEFIRLDKLRRNAKCQKAHEAFVALIRPPLATEERQSGLQPPSAALQAVLDYVRYAYIVQQYMDAQKVPAETALARIGDLVFPPALAPDVDPFDGCIVFLGMLLDKPYTYQGDNPTEGFVFYWQSRDWRAEEQSGLTIVEQFLPSEKRTLFERFVFDYAIALSHMLRERLEKGEITLLQWVKATSAGNAYLIEQGTLYGAQLRENLVQAQAEDAKLLATVAAGLGAVATTALAVFDAYQDYRIANAQAAQARLALVPVRCSYLPPGRYRTQGYLECR